MPSKDAEINGKCEDTDTVRRPNDTDRLANNEDPDETYCGLCLFRSFTKVGIL